MATKPIDVKKIIRDSANIPHCIMRPIATDKVAWSVCLCDRVSVGRDRESCKTTKPIEMLLGRLPGYMKTCTRWGCMLTQPGKYDGSTVL